MKKMLTVFFLLLVGGAAYYAYQKKNNVSESAEWSSLPTLTVGRGSIEQYATAVGYVVPQSSIDIKSQVDGIVGKIYFREGEIVSAGQPLVKVLPNPTPQALTDAITAVKQSEANLVTEEQTLASLQGLVDQKIIPENYTSYVQAKAAVETRKAELEQRHQSLALLKSGETLVGGSQLSSTVFAPIDGTILDINVDLGSSVMSTSSGDSATKIMTIANMKSLKFKGVVSEFDAAKLSKGVGVALTVVPFPNETFSATLTEVAVQSANFNDSKMKDRFANGFEVEANQIQFPNSMLIRSGYSAVAKITVEKVENALIVPERVIVYEGEQAQVMVPSEDGLDFKQVNVSLGLTDGINVEIKSGLTEGDMVIDASLFNVTELSDIDQTEG